MTQAITAAQLKAIAGPNARSDLVVAIVRGWPAAVQKAKLTTKLRAAHFLAQIMTETGGLQVLSESGAYRFETILKIFGAKQYSVQYGGRGHSAGIVPAEAKRIAALPVAQRGPVLFNRVYGVGNPKKAAEFKNTGPNDGWLYRGGGMMQCTGKSNYAKMEKKTGLPLVAHPELLHQPDSAFTAAYLEWIQDGRCNAAADLDRVVDVRQIINGGQNGIAECKAFLAKAKKALVDYGAAAPATFIAPPEEEADATTDEDRNADLQQDAEEDATDAPVAAAEPAAIDPDVQGDPDLYSAQKRLKGRHYPPGLLDGKWGSGTSGAISSFRNDSSLDFAMPQSLEEFHGIKDELWAELSRWEAAKRFRPVSPERKAGDANVVATLAPEVVPAKRGFWATVSAFFIGVFTWLQDTFVGAFQWAWNLFSEHKDDIPDDPDVRSSIWEHVTAIPHAVWWVIGLSALGWLAFNNWSTANKITTSVKTGVRQ